MQINSALRYYIYPPYYQHFSKFPSLVRNCKYGILCSTKNQSESGWFFFVQQAVLIPPAQVLSQPEIRIAGRCSSEADGRHIRALRQPKSSGIASRCATGLHIMGIVTLCEFRVSSVPCHFDRAKRVEKSSSTRERTKMPRDLCPETKRRRLPGRGKIAIFVST